jgi:hypothetical protein
MSVEKPWMDESPDPSTSQTEGAVPGLLFSQITGLLPVPHGSAACADGAFTTNTVESTITRVVTIA